MTKTYFITGASRGLGLEFTKEAIRRGNTVIATARAESSLDNARSAGARSAQWDQAVPLEQLQKQAEVIIETHGPVDVLIVNAGYIQQGILEETSPADIQRQFDTNVFGVINTVKAFLPHMRSRRSGTIVVLGSIGGWFSMSACGVYCMSKFAVRGVSETFMHELKPFGIKVLHVEPGYFRTDFLSGGGGRSISQGHIKDYDEQREATHSFLDAGDHNQPGDPVKAAKVVIDCIAGEGQAAGKEVPWLIALGSDAYQAIGGTLDTVKAGLEEWKELSLSTDL